MKSVLFLIVTDKINNIKEKPRQEGGHKDKREWVVEVYKKTKKINFKTNF